MANDDDIIIVEEEDPEERMMKIDDISAEPIDSTRVNRCGHCRRMQYGHQITYGAGKCTKEKITDDNDLAEDDEIKLEMRRRKRGEKRERDMDDSKKEVTPKRDKKRKDEKNNWKRKMRKLKEDSYEKEKEREKSDNYKLIKEELEKKKRIKKALDEEDRRIATALGGAKQKSFQRMDNRNRD